MDAKQKISRHKKRKNLKRHLEDRHDVKELQRLNILGGMDDDDYLIISRLYRISGTAEYTKNTCISTTSSTRVTFTCKTSRHRRSRSVWNSTWYLSLTTSY